MRVYSELEINSFRSMPKKVLNPLARWSQKPKRRPVHKQRNFHVVGMDDEKIRFMIYQRQNLKVLDDYSCGISYIARGASPLTLARYNGASHIHGDIAFQSHIHHATETAIATGKRAESRADASDRFETLEGALSLLVGRFQDKRFESRS
ncbi:MAG: hypothetical protein OXD01_00345 [Gammaproteobacteria bacterium]|nr:hypothetical protein [Gammaproteobacteria bacterium]